MSRGLVEFEEMQAAFIAIRDIDAIVEGNSATKLEDAWNVLSSISKDKFDSVTVNQILKLYRESLVRIYLEKETELNSSVGIIEN